jgi:hypothetical protein
MNKIIIFDNVLLKKKNYISIKLKLWSITYLMPDFRLTFVDLYIEIL